MCLVQSQMDVLLSNAWPNRFNSHIELFTKEGLFSSAIQRNFSKLKWMHFFFKCLFVFKCINNLSSEFYADIFKQYLIHGRDTRSSSNNNLAIPKCRQNALRCSGSVLWNDLPTEFKEKYSLGSFKIMPPFTVAYE